MIHSNLSASIALCTYNGEKYLQEQLDSLSKQTRLPDELVVCDDGSSDNTVDLLRSFAKTAPFSVRIEQNTTNLGFVHNFEKCSKMCSGDIIFFSDQDDIWALQKIETFMNIFEQQPEIGIVLSDAELIDSNGNSRNVNLTESLGLNAQKVQRIVESNCSQFSIHYNTWTGMTMAYRNIYSDILYPYLQCAGHDTWTLRIIGAVSKASFINQPLTRYRIHDNNTYGCPTQKFNTVSAAIQYSQNDRIASDHKDLWIDLENVVTRLEQFPDRVLFTDTIQNYKRKAVHHKLRYQLRTRQKNKFLTILHEILNGNYFRFGRGIFSIGMDVLS